MPDYKKEVQNIKQQIITKYSPEKIILFGSAARNEFSEDSDIDILVIKKTDKSKFDRMCKLRRLIEYNIPLDLIIYTPEEIEAAKKNNNNFFNTICSEGVVLYE